MLIRSSSIVNEALTSQYNHEVDFCQHPYLTETHVQPAIFLGRFINEQPTSNDPEIKTSFPHADFFSLSRSDVFYVVASTPDPDEVGQVFTTTRDICIVPGNDEYRVGVIWNAVESS